MGVRAIPSYELVVTHHFLSPTPPPLSMISPTVLPQTFFMTAKLLKLLCDRESG